MAVEAPFMAVRARARAPLCMAFSSARSRPISKLPRVSGIVYLQAEQAIKALIMLVVCLLWLRLGEGFPVILILDLGRRSSSVMLCPWSRYTPKFSIHEAVNSLGSNVTGGGFERLRTLSCQKANCRWRWRCGAPRSRAD